MSSADSGKSAGVSTALGSTCHSTTAMLAVLLWVIINDMHASSPKEDPTWPAISPRGSGPPGLGPPGHSEPAPTRAPASSLPDGTGHRQRPEGLHGPPARGPHPDGGRARGGRSPQRRPRRAGP